MAQLSPLTVSGMWRCVDALDSRCPGLCARSLLLVLLQPPEPIHLSPSLPLMNLWLFLKAGKSDGFSLKWEAEDQASN